MNKKIVIISLILIVICAIIVGVMIVTDNESEEVSSIPTNEDFQNELQNIENIENNIQTNEVEENVVDNENLIQNIVVENTVTPPQTQPTTTSPTTPSTETIQEEPKKVEEKAIDIVKSDWGADSSVKFQIETMDANGDYVVSVRDSSTTEAKAFYTVNTTTGTFKSDR